MTHVLIEQYFNSQIFSWGLLISAVYTYMICNFAFFKFINENLLVWDKVEGDTEGDQIKRKNQRMILLNYVIKNNYMYVIFWYWLTDMQSILPTSFDVTFAFLVYFQQSLVLSCYSIIEYFIANVIDLQITMSTTVNLQTNKSFHDKVYKVIAYQAILSFLSAACALTLLLLLWNFEEANSLVQLIKSFPLSAYILLAYPALLTLVLITKQQKSFVGKLRDSKTM